VAADALVAWVVRQRYLPVEQIVQFPTADVVHLMFVVVGAITKGAVVFLETEGSFRAGMVHGVGTVVVVSLITRQLLSLWGIGASRPNLRPTPVVAPP
jgi:hypothetical protein